ncbi:MAG: carboxymuconolactone decarboxylase family protein [Thalassovita sp.]
MTTENFDRGMAMRKQVLSPEHVERSLAASDEFSRPMQELVTEFCWGAVWARPGLSPRDRSLINLSMIAALGRNKELALHTKGALRNGVTTEEIQEVLLQIAVYCGFPAGLDSMSTVKAAIAEYEDETAK